MEGCGARKHRLLKFMLVLSVSWGSNCLPGRPSSWVTLTDPGCVLGGLEVCRWGGGRGRLAFGPRVPREAGPPSCSAACRLRELCVKLMFLHPVEYGRKAEELLWRKVYYEVIQLIKTNRKHIHSRSTLECAYRTHLVAGIGFYQHLLLYIQSHYQLELQCCIDWTHVTDPLIGQWLGSEPPCRPLGPRGPRGSWSL